MKKQKRKTLKLNQDLVNKADEIFQTILKTDDPNIMVFLISGYCESYINKYLKMGSFTPKMVLMQSSLFLHEILADDFNSIYKDNLLIHNAETIISDLFLGSSKNV